MIPNLIDIDGAPWQILPAGLHRASLASVESIFAVNPHRRKLFSGLLHAAKLLKKSGCKCLYLDGSFVTSKPTPSDFDACWCPDGVCPTNLDPIFLDFDNLRQNQKNKFGGELFPSTMTGAPGQVFLNFFQTEKHSGTQKGMIIIDLTSEFVGANEGEL